MLGSASQRMALHGKVCDLLGLARHRFALQRGATLGTEATNRSEKFGQKRSVLRFAALGYALQCSASHSSAVQGLALHRKVCGSLCSASQCSASLSSAVLCTARVRMAWGSPGLRLGLLRSASHCFAVLGTGVLGLGEIETVLCVLLSCAMLRSGRLSFATLCTGELRKAMLGLCSDIAALCNAMGS